MNSVKENIDEKCWFIYTTARDAHMCKTDDLEWSLSMIQLSVIFPGRHLFAYLYLGAYMYHVTLASHVNTVRSNI